MNWWNNIWQMNHRHIERMGIVYLNEFFVWQFCELCECESRYTKIAEWPIHFFCFHILSNGMTGHLDCICHVSVLNIERKWHRQRSTANLFQRCIVVACDDWERKFILEWFFEEIRLEHLQSNTSNGNIRLTYVWIVALEMSTFHLSMLSNVFI